MWLFSTSLRPNAKYLFEMSSYLLLALLLALLLFCCGGLSWCRVKCFAWRLSTLFDISMSQFSEMVLVVVIESIFSMFLFLLSSQFCFSYFGGRCCCCCCCCCVTFTLNWLWCSVNLMCFTPEAWLCFASFFFCLSIMLTSDYGLFYWMGRCMHNGYVMRHMKYLHTIWKSLAYTINTTASAAIDGWYGVCGFFAVRLSLFEMNK